MKNKLLLTILVFALTFSWLNVSAQDTTKVSVVADTLKKETKVEAPKEEKKDDKKIIWNFKNGIGLVTPDSVFSINFRFRVQGRILYNTQAENDFRSNRIEALIRRLRMRIEGFVVNPKLAYYIQLSFAREDMDWNATDNNAENFSPNVVRDAVVFYRPFKNLQFTFGQTKLPGNRQRVISSGEQQFIDRTYLNRTLNIDRDFGLQFAYEANIKDFTMIFKGAVTSGEGRNSVKSDFGLAYTGKIEILPFGKFTNRGDYFEGDLEREKTPKLSITAGYHFNQNAKRTHGTLGRDLVASRDLRSFFADILFKYRGIAWCAEYMDRHSYNPITGKVSGKDRYVFIGQGTMTQLSYNFKNNVEIAGRYCFVTPFKELWALENEVETVTLGVTKYLNKHRVKIQGNISYEIARNLVKSSEFRNWVIGAQVELGI